MAAADIKIVNSNGEFAVATPDYEKEKGIYYTSDKTIPMAGNLSYSKDLEMMIKDAVNKTASYYSTEINKNL